MWNDEYYLGLPGMLVAMVVGWGLVGGSVYLAARWLGRGRPSTDPLDILDERLARGEIDVEEYTRLWQAIADRRPVAGSR